MTLAEMITAMTSIIAALPDEVAAALAAFPVIAVAGVFLRAPSLLALVGLAAFVHVALRVALILDDRLGSVLLPLVVQPIAQPPTRTNEGSEGA